MSQFMEYALSALRVVADYKRDAELNTVKRERDMLKNEVQNLKSQSERRNQNLNKGYQKSNYYKNGNFSRTSPANSSYHHFGNGNTHQIPGNDKNASRSKSFNQRSCEKPVSYDRSRNWSERGRPQKTSSVNVINIHIKNDNNSSTTNSRKTSAYIKSGGNPQRKSPTQTFAGNGQKN